MHLKSINGATGRRQIKRAGLLANDGHDGHHSDDGLTAAEGAAKLLANK